MTRKKALILARDSLKDEVAKKIIQEIIEDWPIHEWSKKSIIDAIEQFIEEEGRAPRLSEFQRDKRLPKPSTLRYWMGFSLIDFLKKFYPDYKKCNSGVYFAKTKEEWLEVFINNYHKHKPISANEYNKLRDKGTPTWAVFAQLYGFTKWNDFMKFTELKRYTRIRNQPSIKLEIVSYNDLLQDLNVKTCGNKFQDLD